MNVIKHYSPLLKEVELKNEPVILRINKFDEATAKAFSGAMMRAQNTGQHVVPVIIDSYGGQVYSLLSMIADIKASRIPVATIVQGKAMSCGAFLFSCGSNGHRYMDPDATLMIHEVSSMAWGKIEEIKASAEETERLNAKLFAMLDANCGQRDGFFLDKVHERGHSDWFLEADEVQDLRLADHLHIPELKISVNVGFDFK